MSDRYAAQNRLGLTTSLILMTACCGVFVAAGTAAGQQPDLSVGAKEYPNADAIIIRWDQSWKIHPDGSVTRREHQWVKLMNTRPIRRFGDPRVDFHATQDTVVIHTAQAHLPNGEILPVPDYGFNLGAAGDVDGWPAYAQWQQHIVSFSGIEPGVTLELDYEVTTKAGVLPWVSADIRLDDEYPVVERRVAITAPAGQQVTVRTSRAGGKDVAGGMRFEFDRTFGPYPASPNEPHAPSWVERSPWLRFSTVQPVPWVNKQVDAVSKAAGADQRIDSFAAEATKEATTVEQRLQAIADRIRSRLNVVDSPKTRRECKCRPAAEVLRDHYGNPLEAGALLLAACRAAGIEAEPMLAVTTDHWDGETAVDAAFSAVVVSVKSGGHDLYVHPTQGLIADPGEWGGHTLLSVGADEKLRSKPIRKRGQESASELLVAGKLTVDEDGTVKGKLTVRMTGAFFDPQSLESSSAQSAALGRLVSRVSSSLSIDDHTIVTLSGEVLVAEVHVSTNESLPKIKDAYVFEFSEDLPCLERFPIPLNRSARRLAVELPGPFMSDLEVTVEIPEAWSIKLAPDPVRKVAGSWGELSQSVEPASDLVRVHRRIHVAGHEVEPDVYGAVRGALNDVRATGRRLVMFGP